MVKDELEKLAGSIEKEQDACEKISFDASQDIEQAYTAMACNSLFGDVKIVIVNNLHLASQSVIDSLNDFIGKTNAGCFVLLAGEKSKVLQKLANTVKKTGEIIDVKKPNYYQLEKIARDMFASKGVKITPQAVKLIATNCTNDLSLLKNEVEKILIYCQDNLITDHTIRNVVTKNVSERIFVLTDKISEGSTGQALREMIPILNNSGPLYILNMLKRHFRMIVKSKGLTVSQIMSKLRTGEFTAKKLYAQNKKYDLAKAKKAFGILLESERTAKSTGEPEFAVERAVIMLSGL